MMFSIRDDIISYEGGDYVMKHTKVKENQIIEGVIWRQVLIFFFPIVVGTIFQQFYNTVDAIIVGRFVGKEALASVGGSAAVLSYQIIAFFTGLSSGATVIISQCYGAGDSKRLHKGLHTAFAFSIIISLAIAVIGWLTTPWLLAVTKTPSDIMADSIVYLRIYFLGILSTLLYNIGSSIMRAIGDSRRPLYYLMVCSILNITLDLLFVIVFKMGIAGAAIATVIAQTASAILVIRALMVSYDMMKLELRSIRLDRQMLKAELRIGVPAGLQACMYGITNIIIQTVINGFGTDTAAAWAAFSKMDLIFWAVSGAFGITITTFAGQNLGAGRMDRVYKSVRTTLGMSLVLSGSLLVLLMVFADPLFHLFTTDAEVIEIGVYMLHYLTPSYAIYIFVEILTGALRGLGDVLVPTGITLGGICLVRLPWILIVTPMRHDIGTLMVSYPLAWGTTLLFLAPYYFYRKWKVRKRGI